MNIKREARALRAATGADTEALADATAATDRALALALLKAARALHLELAEAAARALALDLLVFRGSDSEISTVVILPGWGVV